MAGVMEILDPTNNDHGLRGNAAQIPPPWHLTGRGCILAIRFPAEYLREHSGLPASLRDGLRSTVSWVMFVDYEAADCGPYRELLFIPGTCRFSEGRFLTISKIFVSTEASVTNGRANWGIPKERCEFEVARSGSEESVRLARDGRSIVELSFFARGPRLPMILGLLPRRWLTLGQHWEGDEFVYAPEAQGRFRFARVSRAWSKPSEFPDFSKGRVLGCFAVPDFRMVFPPSQIRKLACTATQEQRPANE